MLNAAQLTNSPVCWTIDKSNGSLGINILDRDALRNTLFRLFKA